MIDWINKLNTTNVRILTSIGLAVFGVIAVLSGILWRGWTPSPVQVHVLEGCAAVVLTMMGFDVLQFVGKRFSDATYAAAKNPSQPVAVDRLPTSETKTT